MSEKELVRPLITAERRRAEMPMALRLYASGQVYANPVVMEALDGTGRPTGYLMWDEQRAGLGALHWVKKRTGAVKIRRTGEGATWTAGPILAYYPALRVQKGYARLLPIRVEDGLFLVELTGEVEKTQ